MLRPLSTSPVIGISLDYCEPGAYSARSPWYALRVHYADAVEHHGGCPLMLPYAMHQIDRYIALCDGILIPGGDFDPDPALYGQKPHPTVTLKPARTEFEYALIQKALNVKIPLFGICGGMQLLNVVRGGSLIQDIPTQKPDALPHSGMTTHALHIQPGSMLHRITQTTECIVNTSHHQAVDRLGMGLVASAHTHDGVIEAIEDPALPFCIGTQWHPEYEEKAMEKSLLRAFIQAASLYHDHKI